MIESRLDVGFYQPAIREYVERLRLAHPSLPVLDSVAEVVCGPFGSAIKLDDYRADGVPLIRISDITDDGRIDVRGLVFLDPAFASDFSRSTVEPGDLVISQRGTLGVAAVIPTDFKKWCISANLIGIRRPRLSADYIQAYLNFGPGRVQLLRAQSGQVQGKITTGDVAGIQIPDIERARSLVAAIGAARERREKMLADADALLAGLDGYVLDQLGLTLPPSDGRMVYAARLGDGVRQRADPLFHTPRYRELQRRLERVKAELLGTVANLSTERQDPSEGDGPTFRYIEISSVSAETGEAFAVDTLRAEAPSRARMVVHDGNIVVSLTRPQRGSIALIDESLEGCIASTGFAVLSIRDSRRVQGSYLWAFLRTQAARLQMLQRSSGGNYPAITEDELKRVAVPIPDGPVQAKIAAEVARRREKARALRADAANLWEQAKADFEAALLGPPAEPKKGGK